MSHSESHRIDDILARILDLPEAERSGAIEKESGDDIALKNELIKLVSSYDKAEGFFDDMARDLGLPGTREVSPPTRPSNMTDPSALIGQTIAQYRIVDFIGGGGMGSVYRAEDTKLGRHVALKFLPASMGQDKLAQERFLREARAASALDHPNICTVFEIGEEGGHSFIAMAFYEGSTIENPVKRILRGPFFEACHF